MTMRFMLLTIDTSGPSVLGVVEENKTGPFSQRV